MNNSLKKTVSIFVSTVLIVLSAYTSVCAKETGKKITVGEVGGYLAGNARATKNLYLERKFKYPGGSGFAAERANNLSDILKGKNAKVVGDNNVKNGPDRIIKRFGTETWIQDKYYRTAKQSINAAFDTETGMYRYTDSEGEPMQLEVPKEQYKEVVSEMEKKISDGKVDGVTNPKEAETIVREGTCTYKQAVNITKARTLDSLKHDAKNGVVTATVAFGIAFVLDYATCRINGSSGKEALKDASLNGLKTGSVVFGSYTVASQLAKTGLSEALTPASDAVANALGSNIQKALIEAAGEEASKMTGKQLIEKTSQILRKDMIVASVVFVALSTPKVISMFKGRISKKQFVKDVATLLISLVGMKVGTVAGGAAGSAIAPGAGTAIGGFAGGIALGALSGFLGEKALSLWYEGDASRMYDIITKEFQSLAEDYLIVEKEGDELVDTLKDKLDDDTLKNMYASKDRKKFARKLMEPMFEEEVKKRGKIVLPTEKEARSEYRDLLQGIVFVH